MQLLSSIKWAQTNKAQFAMNDHYTIQMYIAHCGGEPEQLHARAYIPVLSPPSFNNTMQCELKNSQWILKVPYSTAQIFPRSAVELLQWLNIKSQFGIYM